MRCASTAPGSGSTRSAGSGCTTTPRDPTASRSRAGCSPAAGRRSPPTSPTSVADPAQPPAGAAVAPADPATRRTTKQRRARSWPSGVRAALLAILGAAAGISTLLGGFYDVTVWGPIALGIFALALALVAGGTGRPRLTPAVAVGALAFLCLWSWVSVTWAESADSAYASAGRWAFYAAALLALILLMRRHNERWVALAF